MKTREQKKQIIDETEKLIADSKNIFFVDFTGISDTDMKILKKSLREMGAKIKIIKKRLLRVSLEKKGVDFNPEQFEAQVATIFYSNELSDVASPVYKFFKENEKKGFKILGAYDLSGKSFMDESFAKMLGQLPSREVLLGQFVGMLAAPIRMFLYVLDQKSKQ